MLFQCKTEPQRVKPVGLPKAIHWNVVLALEAEGIGGLGCGVLGLGLGLGLGARPWVAWASPGRAAWLLLPAELPAYEPFLSSLLLGTATAVKQRGGWKLGFTGGFLPDPPNPVLSLLSLRALFCRVYHTVPLHGLMHRREQEEFSVASTSLK